MTDPAAPAPEVAVENIERVQVEAAPAKIPSAAQVKPGTGLAAIMSPDSAIRAHPAYQIANRMWRPAGGWALVAGLVYGLCIGPWIGKPLGPVEWTALSALVVAMWGLKTLEKRDGVA